MRVDLIDISVFSFVSHTSKRNIFGSVNRSNLPITMNTPTESIDNGEPEYSLIKNLNFKFVMIQLPFLQHKLIENVIAVPTKPEEHTKNAVPTKAADGYNGVNRPDK
ncbi:hypothetical protein RF11_04375 [Thelohanellus kitauei]|uniref:Uncharacterized protein n=1 Tax=Thelohanellus kitauei TaxID=669202 RepID=A0A0C2J9E6_THEKT|nr:hypothetical protein RF11_04375 [Thelohanellus kitauei]